MRSSKTRSRSKSNRQRSLGNVVNRVFDSSGPEGKVRGTPQQIIEKYLTLARDAQLSHDRVAEQSFLQHAEHYTRMLGEAQREMAERQSQNPHHHRQDDDGGYSNHGYGNSQNGNNHNGNGQHNGQNGHHNNGQNQSGQRDNQGDSQSDSQGDHGQSGQQPRRGDGPRDQQPREQQPREQQPRRDPQPRTPRQPRVEQADQPSAPAEVAETPVQQTSLPDAVNAGDDDTAMPVTTPESEPAEKPVRTRSTRPRTPRKPSATPTTRSRRKPVAEGDAVASDAAPTQSNDQD
ncbi:DUF4167 domain-containing protein [Paracoccus sp. JM45]|uniref:DUF4167 domain-containing protein n=1 Tax=Paracoccus sp. JM45 TaxID=2283626 RepID=UPI000E6CD716|nr:DUF4167 domain-containing protein [Paracoccus sp. JM45]RJE79565.1 DUF4167 domain-containing protein [Paracoccus sp. JM45]